MEEAEYEVVLPPLLSSQMESIHSFYTENGVRYFFIKLRGKSFRKCRWVPEDEVFLIDNQAKAKLNRFVKDYEKRFQSGEQRFINYDPSSLEVDRILDTSELFPILHPKKSSQMTGSWLYGLYESLRKLITFDYKDNSYGLEMLYLADSQPLVQNDL